MDKIADPHYLRTDQYRDAQNLNARIALHLRFSTNSYGWMRWVFDQVDLPPSGRVLEVGCGPGKLWVENRPRIPAGWQITLSDFSPGMAQAARQALGGTGRPFRFLVSDAQAIPCPAGQFDAVIANHMLYHVPDLARALAEIRRVLRPGGRFYAATNGATHLQGLDTLIDRFDPTVPFWRAAPEAATLAPAGAAAAPFDLEHGGAELARVFPEVALRRYPDALVVTEADPLVAYILSTSSKANLTTERVADLRRFVQEELAAHGAIHIVKDSGLFVAR